MHTFVGPYGVTYQARQSFSMVVDEASLNFASPKHMPVDVPSDDDYEEINKDEEAASNAVATAGGAGSAAGAGAGAEEHSKGRKKSRRRRNAMNASPAATDSTEPISSSAAAGIGDANASASVSANVDDGDEGGGGGDDNGQGSGSGDGFMHLPRRRSKHGDSANMMVRVAQSIREKTPLYLLSSSASLNDKASVDSTVAGSSASLTQQQQQQQQQRQQPFDMFRLPSAVGATSSFPSPIVPASASSSSSSSSSHDGSERLPDFPSKSHSHHRSMRHSHGHSRAPTHPGTSSSSSTSSSSHHPHHQHHHHHHHHARSSQDGSSSAITSHGGPGIVSGSGSGSVGSSSPMHDRAEPLRRKLVEALSSSECTLVTRRTEVLGMFITCATCLIRTCVLVCVGNVVAVLLYTLCMMSIIVAFVFRSQ